MLLAGANSIFYGEKLLTTGNPDVSADQNLLAETGFTAAPVEALGPEVSRPRRRLTPPVSVFRSTICQRPWGLPPRGVFVAFFGFSGRAGGNRRNRLAKAVFEDDLVVRHLTLSRPGFLRAFSDGNHWAHHVVIGQLDKLGHGVDVKTNHRTRLIAHVGGRQHEGLHRHADGTLSLVPLQPFTAVVEGPHPSDKQIRDRLGAPLQ